MNEVSSLRPPFLHSAIWIGSAILLTLALLPLPYGYYTVLRIVITLSATLLAYKDYQLENKASVWGVGFVIIAILFNPLIPIHLSRFVWGPIDLMIAVWYLVHWKVRGGK